MAVDWMGNVPSDDIAALFGINEATDFTQFRAALTGWRAPTQNFVYADKAGNIGVIAPGYYPQVAAGCQPWLPMPGTGACDVTGVIPVQAVPQVYDPPSHLIVTANQRPVQRRTRITSAPALTSMTLGTAPPTPTSTWRRTSRCRPRRSRRCRTT